MCGTSEIGYPHEIRIFPDQQYFHTSAPLQIRHFSTISVKEPIDFREKLATRLQNFLAELIFVEFQKFS